MYYFLLSDSNAFYYFFLARLSGKYGTVAVKAAVLVLCLILRGKLCLSPLSMKLAVGFSSVCFTMLRKVPSIPSLPSGFDYERVLNLSFFISMDMNVLFLLLFMWHIYSLFFSRRITFAFLGYILLSHNAFNVL